MRGGVFDRAALTSSRFKDEPSLHASTAAATWSSLDANPAVPPFGYLARSHTRPYASPTPHCASSCAILSKTGTG